MLQRSESSIQPDVNSCNGGRRGLSGGFAGSAAAAQRNILIARHRARIGGRFNLGSIAS